ncbi:MAG: ExbD/TolR family protein [Planctomycetota bacterium]|jgi:hypothetical protein
MRTRREPRRARFPKVPAIAVGSAAVLLLAVVVISRMVGGSGKAELANLTPLELPEVTGLSSGKSAGPSTAGSGPGAVVEMTVEVLKTGRYRVAGMRTVRPWRGVNPAWSPDRMVTGTRVVAGLDAVVVKVRAAESRALETPEYRIRSKACHKTDELAGMLRAHREAFPGMQLVISGEPTSPFVHVALATAVSLEEGLFPSFRQPLGTRPKPGDVRLLQFPPPPGTDVPVSAEAAVFHDGRLPFEDIAEADVAGPASYVGLESLERTIRDEALRHRGSAAAESSELAVRMRASKHAPYAYVLRVLAVLERARVWRVSFAAVKSGREVVVGYVDETQRGPRPSLRDKLKNKPLPKYDPRHK